MLTLGLGRSSTRVMPSVGSGRYWPGPGTEMLLREVSYQEIRPTVAGCSLIRPDFLAIDSECAGRVPSESLPPPQLSARMIRGNIDHLAGAMAGLQRAPVRDR